MDSDDNDNGDDDNDDNGFYDSVNDRDVLQYKTGKLQNDINNKNNINGVTNL